MKAILGLVSAPTRRAFPVRDGAGQPHDHLSCGDDAEFGRRMHVVRGGEEATSAVDRQHLHWPRQARPVFGALLRFAA